MSNNEKAPREAGLMGDRDAWVSGLRWDDDEAWKVIIHRMAAEIVDACPLENLGIDDMDFGLLFAGQAAAEYLNDIYRIVPIAAGDASSLGELRISFDPAGYRRAAEAAKDRVLTVSNGNFGQESLRQCLIEALQ
jgi:hypothetical protein